MQLTKPPVLVLFSQVKQLSSWVCLSLSLSMDLMTTIFFWSKLSQLQLVLLIHVDYMGMHAAHDKDSQDDHL